MSSPSLYDEDYYLRGRITGKSLYTDYRWLPEMTVPMVQAVVRNLGISHGETILDFGCARGYTVRALRELGYRAYGVDCSEWALENADETVRRFLSSELNSQRFDWVLAKDVLEHVPEVNKVITDLMVAAGQGVLAVVPLAPEDGAPYAIPDYEKDITHLHRLTLATWAAKFIRPFWSVEASYRMVGVKDNWWEASVTGNGFLTARRCPT